jgi:hypothetical protein
MRTMKRSVLGAAFVMFFLSSSVFADGQRFGFKAGPTLSFVNKDGVIWNYPRRLWAAKLGLFVAFPISAGLSIQPEAYFAMKGARYYDSGIRAEQSVHMNYFEVPILLNVQALRGALEVFAGPYVAFLLRSTPNEPGHHWAPYETRVAKSDYGVTTGVRYHVLRHLFAEIQLNAGLKKVAYDPEYPDHGPHRNLTLSLLVGYRR